MDIWSGVALIIPSLNPTEKMLTLLKGLRQKGFYHIIIVNDGSASQYDDYYQQARENYGCTVLVHEKNQGKGQALKTGFSYVVSALPECLGVLTVDSDGQHLPEDVVACAEILMKNQNALVLGCRDFWGQHIPWKSRMGNIITDGVLGILCGIWLKDTQTGLRAIPFSVLDELIGVFGDGFEYETNMLLFSKERGISIIELPIKTIYAKGGHTTHFHLLKDSVRIYALFLKFIVTSGISFLLDIGVFQMFITMLRGKCAGYIVISTFFARGISSFFNFILNKKQVFHTKEKIKPVLVRYYILCCTQMLVSAGLVQSIYLFTSGRETIIKVCVDIVLFLISFQIQREWVFGRRKKGRQNIIEKV